MEANNHFNYGPHSSVSANSGLKLSSGDSLYTNGSSMSFPQHGKNINGDMNVNGITTAIGTSQPGPHPPSSSYPHMSNHHHQGSMAYDYLWGQPQYSPAMPSGPTHSMHQKQGSPGVLQQNQHHFQSHGQYQVNGAMGASHQSPVSGAPNVSLGPGQYWNRANPTQQQSGASMAMGYNSHSVYGSYQSQVHPGLSPAQHHQQSPMAHQGPPTHHHPHHPHPHHPHAHHHPQQPQHYGMVPNGMPYYQHQPQHPPQHPPLPSPQPQHPAQHQPLPSPQPQHPPTHQQLASPQPQHPPQHQTLPSPQHASQHQTLPSPQHPPQHQPLPSPQPQHAPQPQSQMMPPTSQNFTPPRGSPQHHHMGRGATGSPLPMQVPMMSPSAVPDGGSPQSRDSPLSSSVPLPPVMPGRLGEAYKEVDKGYNGVERASVGQRLPKADAYPARPSGHLMVPSSEYCQRVPHGALELEPRHQQHHDMGGPMRELMHPAVSAPPPLLSTPPRQAPSGPPHPPPVVSMHHMTASEPPSSSAASTSAPPQVGAKTPHGSPVSAPAPMLSSPPLMVQGLRPLPGAMSPSSHGGAPSELLPTASSMSGPPPLMGHTSMPVPLPAPLPAVTSSSPVVSASHASVPATSASPLWTSAPPVSASPQSQAAYVPPQMVQAPRLQEASKPCSPVSSPSKVAQAPKAGELLKPLSPVSAPPVAPPALPSGVSAVSLSPSEAPASSLLSASPQKGCAPSSPMLSSQTASSLPDAAVSGRAPAAGVPAAAPISTPPPVAVAAPHCAASVPPAAAASSPPAVSAAPQAASVSLPASGAPPPRAAAPPKAVSALPAVSAPTQAATAPPGGSMPPPPPPQPVSGLPAVSTPPQAGSAPSVSVPSPASEAASSPLQAAGQASQGSDRQDSSDAGKDSSHKAASKKEVSAPQLEEDVDVDNSAKLDSILQAPHSKKSADGPSDVATETSAHKAESPAKSVWPEIGMTPAPARDHDTPRKTASLDDTFVDMDCTSLAESTHLESSQAEDTSVMEGTFDDSITDNSCMDEPSMFTEDSVTDDSRQVAADDTQEDGHSSQVDETMDSCLSTRESGTEDDSSQLKDSVSDDSQNDGTRMSADDQDPSRPLGKGPEESEKNKEEDMDTGGDGRDAPDCAGVPTAAVMLGTAGTPVSVDEGWQKMVAAVADPSAAEQAAKPLPLSTSAVTLATAPLPPQKPAAKRAKAQATAKQDSQASQTSQKKTPVKVPKEEKEKRKRKKNEDKEPAGTRKKRKLTKDDGSGSATAEMAPLTVSTPDATGKKGAADQSLASGQSPPAKPKKIRKPKQPKQVAGASAATPPKADGDQSLETNQTPPAKPKKARKPREPKVKDGAAKAAKAAKTEPKETSKAEQDNEDDEEGSTTGETPKRRIATEEQVHFPLMHGWKREVRVKKHEDRLKGETWYYSPCGRRMKQFPEIIKYLRRHECGAVTREHFSFSPRMPVGDFYEERDSPEGMKWFLLANEEVPSMIMAITGRRGRPPNPDKEKPRARVRRPKGTPGRRPGRPPKTNAVDLLSKVDARMLKRLQAKEVLTDEDKEKLVKIKKKMKRKARLKRKEDAKNKIIRQEKRKAKLEKAKEAKDQHPGEEEKPAQPGQPQSQPPADQQAPQPAAEPKKPGRKKRVQTAEELEKAGQVKRVAGARSQAKALAKAQAEAEAQAQAALAAKRQAERRAQAQRRLEERKRQQQILEELKKPTEDMCLMDHQPLPELSRVPGVVLSGRAFSHCLTVVEFLHSYGKVLGLQVPKDVPSLSTLQEGLLGVGESQAELMDLLIKLVEAALHDPGLPSYYQSVKLLGEKLVDLELSQSTVSECLRIFLESHGFELDVCNSLRTKTFQALKPDVKASILAFLVEELNASNTVTRDIDNTLENMTTYRKNKWIIEGKLRKLKAALVRRTGRSEEELCLDDRRRSTRAGTAEEENLEESTMLERSSRRGRGVREEPKLTEAESPTNASIPELERQIDKLTKRQVFFRKKLQQASHSLRAVSLGQDRYRRRYWLMPHMGAILVEGPEEVLDSGDVLLTDEPMVYVKKEVKVEVKSEQPLSPVTPIPPPPTAATPATPRSCSPRASGSAISPTEVDPLPGEASLMSSSPRGRGRPRKIKPEVELHLRTAKNRRRRRSSKSAAEETATDAAAKLGAQTDLAQAAIAALLKQAQAAGAQDPAAAAAVLAAVAAGGKAPEDGGLSEEAMKELAEKQAQWFHLLPKTPCDASSHSEPCLPSPNATSPTSLKDAPPNALSPQAASTPLSQTPLQIPVQVPVQPGALPPGITPLLPVLTGSAPVPPACSTPAPKPTRRRRRGSSPARRPYSRPGTGKRRGRPPSTQFQEIEQKYLTQLVVKPIPKEMVQGWWWVKEPEELTAVLQALHPRGVREKVLHKHLTKHLDFLSEVCSRPVSDPVFKSAQEEGSSVLDVLSQPWPEMHKALQADISALQWVEDLEQRVLAADLHLKMAPQSGKSDLEGNTEEPVAGFQAYTVPEPDSTREDLEFYEHEVDPRDDWIIRTKREWSDLLRVPNNPLDLAVLRLANLERNIERRYLKEPLWNLAEVVRLAPLTPPPGEEVPMDVVSLEMEITPRLRTWRQALDRCRSAAQLSLCILQLERAIAWEKSVVKVTCLVCRKGDNDEYLLLCDGCDRGCHMFCLRPKVTEVPEGDWYCPVCVSEMDEGELRPQRSARQRARRRKRRLGVYGADSSEEEDSPRRTVGMCTRQKDGPSSSGTNGTSGVSPSKRRRMTTRNQPDLTYCEIILMEMEAHADAWPFLEPVNPRLVPGYRRIIKNPMDFLTMRERLLQGGYCSVEEFAADAQLVFNNCELFNEDTSEVGIAGHSMRRFFESRWAEFYQTKDKDK